ncbi:hypothetical protein SARC_02149 [Sphaeroforma arctica JP610]|uniref:Uncharacterized protein n=1 Tax=Sphaeroforma arctica JP610 TaxID=667725 RepID=A0A0L0G9J1_9EUKA|nr:hypothetical protein SARC_02149 [Sphaeroforma arctica JP610]KNC85665.1 hypothetical protein SARC_02149 [Sphaeroforma arctica JP610]|eukprot:XP_014159567.1 hypothetical protein SARC_02149 [Sphaeroforma arctica JP610]
MGLARNLILALTTVKSLSGQGSIREAYLSKKGGPTFNWQGYDDYGYDVMGFDEFGYDLYGKPMYDPYAGLQGSRAQLEAHGQFFDPSHGTHLEDSNVEEYVDKYDGADGEGDKDDDGYEQDKYEYPGKKYDDDDDDVPWWHKPFPSGTDKADPGWWDWYWEEVSMTDALPTASIFFTDTFDFKFPRPDRPTTMTETETTTKITPTAYITTTGGSSMTITVPATEVYSCGRAAYCQEYETECCDGVPLCKPGKCEYGYYNSLSLVASECIDTELCIAGSQSVAISGDGCWVIQGVPSNTTQEAITSTGLGLDDEQLLWRGWATVWHLADGVWLQYQLLIPSDGVLADWFGISVDICNDGSRIVVGSWLDSENGVRSGSAYVFSWAPGTHTYRQEAKLMPSDGQAFDYFGQSVRISHDCDTVVVGAFGNDANGALSGAAYVYLVEEIPGTIPSHSPSPTPNFNSTYGPNITFIDPTQAKKDRKQKCDDEKNLPIQTHRWIEVQKIDLGFDGSPMDMFGQSLAVNGDGTRIFISGRNIESVLYYKFEMSFMRWILQEEIKPDQTGMMAFGHSIDTDIAGTTLAVGAPWGSATSSFNDTDEGLVYIYEQNINISTSYELAAGTPLTSPNSAEDNFFGFSVALNGANGSYLLVGEPGFDYNETDTLTNVNAYLENAGAAYIYSNWCGYWDYYGLMFNATLTTSTDDTGVTTVSPINYFFGVSVDMDDCATDIVIADSYNKVDVFTWVPYFTPIFNVTVTSNAEDEPIPAIEGATVTLTGPLPNTTTRVLLTNVDGYVTFETVDGDIIKPGDYNVTVEADGYFGPQTGSVTLAMNAITNMYFTLSTNPRVAFYVEDSVTGGNLTLPGTNTTSPATFNVFDANGTLVQSGTTVYGELNFLGPFEVGSYTYNVTAEGYDTGSGAIDMALDVFYTITESMVPSFAEVTALITDTDGAVLPGVLVTINSTLGGIYQETTDADGWANFSLVRTGDLVFTASKTDFSSASGSLSLGTAGASLTASLNPTSLTFEITSNLTGLALEGALVEILTSEGTTLSQTTPANGSVIFDYLTSGTTTYNVTADFHFVQSGSVDLAEGFATTQPLDLQSDIAEVQVTVVNNLDNVVAGAEVSYEYANGTVVTETTDALGQVLLVDVDTGVVSVNVVADTYDNQTATATAISGTLVESEITLVSQIAVLNVTLFQADGSAFDVDAEVTLTTTADGTEQVLDSGSSGEVSYLNVTPGAYELSITAVNMATITQTGTTVADDNANLNVTIFASSANFAFTVVGPDSLNNAGVAVDDAVITLTTSQSGISTTGTTDTTGAASISGIEAGEYTYTVSATYFEDFTPTPVLDYALNVSEISVPVTLTRSVGSIQFLILNSTSNTPIESVDAIISLENADLLGVTTEEDTSTGFATFTDQLAGNYIATPTVGATAYPSVAVEKLFTGTTNVTISVT